MGKKLVLFLLLINSYQLSTISATKLSSILRDYIVLEVDFHIFFNSNILFSQYLIFSTINV